MPKTDEILKAAGKMFKEKRFGEAMTLYVQVLREDPQNEKAWLPLFACFMNLDRPDEGLEFAERGTELFPDIYAPHHYKVSFLQNLSRHSEAVAAAEEYLTRRPTDPRAWFLKGSALFESRLESRSESGSEGRSREDAISCYEKGLELKPDDHQGWSELGSILAHEGRHLEAVNVFEKVLKLDYKQKFMILGPLGKSLLQLGRFQDAFEAFDRRLNHRPVEAEMHFYRAYTLSKLSQHRFAINSFRKGLDYILAHAAEHYAQGDLKGDLRGGLVRGFPEEMTLEILSAAIEANPQNSDTLYIEGVNHLWNGAHEEAVRSFDRSLALTLQDSETWFMKGFALGHLGRHHDALKAFDRAVLIYPELIEAHKAAQKAKALLNGK